MAAKIIIENINIKNFQAAFTDPIDIQITFSNLVPLQHPVEWKIIYFGSANDEEHDQVLEQFQIPPVSQIQTMKFQLSCVSPKVEMIPRSQLLSVTAMIITVSYRGQQFMRVGYYIHYQYNGTEEIQTLGNYPAKYLIQRSKRTILVDKPRVTKFNIQWSDSSPIPSQSESDMKQNQIEQRNVSDDICEKQLNQQKLSTLQERQQRSNNFSLSKSSICQNSIQCQ